MNNHNTRLPGESYKAPPVGREVRAATFDVSWFLIQEEPGAVKAALRDCIVIRAERLSMPDVVRYLALGDHFPLVYNNEVQRLEPLIHKHEDGGYTVEWPVSATPSEV